MTDIQIKEIRGILNATMGAPPECFNCISFCAEGRIDVPCKGDFICENRDLEEEGET